jgi:hypothetical protein
LNTRNESFTTLIHDLLINSSILIYRESKKWKESYSLIALHEKTAIIELLSEPTKFRATSIKPYYQKTNNEEDQSANQPDDQSSLNVTPSSMNLVPINETSISTPIVEFSAKRDGGKLRKYSVTQANFTSDSNICFLLNESFFDIFASITSFSASRHKKLIELLKKNVFRVTSIDDVSSEIRVFNSRFVDEIKHSGTDQAYEKSRLIVQAYKDQNKDLILTQSSTIQRISQRLVLCLIASLSDTKLYLRDIAQAYVQFADSLNRDFFIKSSHELIIMLEVPPNTILRVIKSLYEVLEAGNHWFKTYHAHYLNVLDMKYSTYDACLLFEHDIDDKLIEVIDMQTDDALILITDQFADEEEKVIHKAKIMIKNRIALISNASLKFNETKICQKKKALKIIFISCEIQLVQN